MSKRTCKNGHDLQKTGASFLNGKDYPVLQCRVCNVARAKARKAARAVAEGRPVGRVGRPPLIEGGRGCLTSR